MARKQKVDQKPVWVPYFSVTPSQVNGYSVRYDTGGPGKLTQRQIEGLEMNTPDGIISHKAALRIRRAIDWLLFIEPVKPFTSPGSNQTYYMKINFITLTLASKQVHSDNEIKSQCLDHFLTELRQFSPGISYIWRAEAQANGNIHFHITTNRFLPWNVLRNKWNRIQNKLGYIDRHQETMKERFKHGFQFNPNSKMYGDYKTQLKRFKSGLKHNWRQPNSTDVHSVHKIKNVAAYLSKYCTKNKMNFRTKKGTKVPDLMLQELKDWALNKMNYQRVNGNVINNKNHIINTKRLSDLEPETLEKAGIIATPAARLIDGKLWGLSQNLSKFSAFRDELSEAVQQEWRKIEVSHPGNVRMFEFCRCAYLKQDWLNTSDLPVLRQHLIDYAWKLCDPIQQAHLARGAPISKPYLKNLPAPLPVEPDPF